MMGFFSWNCTKCGHSIMNPYSVGKDEQWLNEAVVLLPNGSQFIGVYDGYGRIGGIELTLEHTFEMMHQKCWREAGEPKFENQSPGAGGQGHFYDDGAPPERTWRDALEEGDPDYLSVASENAMERERRRG
jgi:hypothetical protein